jgi:hypothetical protein
MGVFAPFTDRATTGTNTVTSDERPKAADLKLAFGVTGVAECGTATYADDLTTPGHALADAEPGDRDIQYFCLRNTGSAEVTASISVIDLADLDHACTGDEQAAGDTTCGGDGLGELSSNLGLNGHVLPCDATSGGTAIFGDWLSASPTDSLGTLAAGATMCGRLEIMYGLNKTAEDVQRAQTDTATWRYAFDATTATAIGG